MLLVGERIFRDKKMIIKKDSLLTGFFYFLYLSNLFFKSSILNPKIKSKIIINTADKKIQPARTNGIQRGEVTHHQDQSMFPVNLRTKNTTNNTPVKPIPDEEDFDAIIYYIPNLSNKLFLF